MPRLRICGVAMDAAASARAGVALLHISAVFQIKERRSGPNHQSTLAVGLDLVEPGDGFEVDHAWRANKIFLHGCQKILASGDGMRHLVGVHPGRRPV